MNRSDRRRLEKAGVTPEPRATPADAKRFIDNAFTDRISWTAARVILERVTVDERYAMLDQGLRMSIERFLERHPAPLTKA